MLLKYLDCIVISTEIVRPITRKLLWFYVFKNDVACTWCATAIIYVTVV